jgi:hypothetical protein
MKLAAADLRCEFLPEDRTQGRIGLDGDNFETLSEIKVRFFAGVAADIEDQIVHQCYAFLIGPNARRRMPTVAGSARKVSQAVRV